MIKCTGYYNTYPDGTDWDHIDKMQSLNMPVDVPEPDEIETDCWIHSPDDNIQIMSIFDLQNGKHLISYSNEWEVVIKSEKSVLDKLI